jgi:hypothetical protein
MREGQDAHGEQLELGLVNTSAPTMGIRDGQLVVDRAACPVERPCNRFSCPHNLWVEDERPGRPHHGVSPPPKLRAREQSCALDVAEQGGISAEQVSKVMGVTSERVNQIEDRALAKVACAHAVLEYLEPLHLRLPAGTTLETMYPEQMDPHRVVITLVLKVDGKTWRRQQQSAGVFVRRKR